MLCCRGLAESDRPGVVVGDHGTHVALTAAGQEDVGFDGAAVAAAERAVDGGHAVGGDVDHGVWNGDGAGTIGVQGADGDHVHGLGGGVEASLAGLLVVRGASRAHVRVGRFEQGCGVVAGTDEDDHVVAVGEPVEEPGEWAQAPGEDTGGVAEGQVHDADAGRLGVVAAVALQHAVEAAVHQVDEQHVWGHRLKVREVRVRFHDRAGVERGG